MSEEQINELVQYNLEYSIEEDLEETKKCLKEANKEIERLNNIIKTKDEGIKAFTEDLCETSIELEKANNIINSINDYLVRNMLNHSLEFTYHLGFKETYDYLQELKGSDK